MLDNFTREKYSLSMSIKLLGISALAVACVLAGLYVSPTSSNAAVSPGCTVDPSIDSEEQEFLQQINQYRQQNNRGPLKLSTTLNKAAAWKSLDMANNGYVAHDDTPSGRSWIDRIRDCGYTYNVWIGENIAVGNNSASMTFEQWHGSSGHNDNMLGSNYTTIGIGRAYNVNSQYRWYWTTEFASFSDGYAAPTPSPTATPQPPTPRPCADVTNDGAVGLADILFVVHRYMTTDAIADLDNDGTVHIQDIVIVVQQYGTGC